MLWWVYCRARLACDWTRCKRHSVPESSRWTIVPLPLSRTHHCLSVRVTDVYALYRSPSVICHGSACTGLAVRMWDAQYQRTADPTLRKNASNMQCKACTYLVAKHCGILISDLCAVSVLIPGVYAARCCTVRGKCIPTQRARAPERRYKHSAIEVLLQSPASFSNVARAEDCVQQSVADWNLRCTDQHHVHA